MSTITLQEKIGEDRGGTSLQAFATRSALFSPKEEIELGNGRARERLILARWRISLQIQIVSLEEPLGEDGEETLGDFIADDKTPAPEQEALRMLMREELDRALGRLTELEKQIIELHFGLKDGRPLSGAEVALKIGLSHEWVRQIEQKALDKLRLFFQRRPRIITITS